MCSSVIDKQFGDMNWWYDGFQLRYLRYLQMSYRKRVKIRLWFTFEIKKAFSDLAFEKLHVTFTWKRAFSITIVDILTMWRAEQWAREWQPREWSQPWCPDQPQLLGSCWNCDAMDWNIIWRLAQLLGHYNKRVELVRWSWYTGPNIHSVLFGN